jgi:hypothetical protein
VEHTNRYITVHVSTFDLIHRGTQSDRLVQESVIIELYRGYRKKCYGSANLYVACNLWHFLVRHTSVYSPPVVSLFCSQGCWQI